MRKKRVPFYQYEFRLRYLNFPWGNLKIYNSHLNFLCLLWVFFKLKLRNKVRKYKNHNLFRITMKQMTRKMFDTTITDEQVNYSYPQMQVNFNFRNIEILYSIELLLLNIESYAIATGLC